MSQIHSLYLLYISLYQKEIAAIFIKHGIKYEPTFDIYIEKYDW
ncbi:hypothetical protein HMPREF2534_01592 [Bacteroides thetaiotaomicron]|jgi:hypothetical protein|nr:hypothetical protein HMPREF2534_01592 [Bacteroides thetaiotaomicron]